MNLRDIKYIVTVAKARNFTKAAKLCNVSQPTLSTQIHKVEENLNTKIFVRNGNSIDCTPIGLKIVEYANVILTQADAIYEISRTKVDPFAGELKLGVFPTLAPYYLPKIISIFSKKYPRVKLVLKEEKTEQLVNMLDDGLIDVAFLSPPIKSGLLETHEMFSEPFYLCLNKNNPLCDLEQIDYKHLREQKILLLEEGHCLREQALDICKMVSTEQRRNYDATSLETLREMVSSDMGVTLIPKMAVRHHENIRYIPFSAPEPRRKIAMVWRSTSPRNEFLNKILNTFTTLHSSLRKTTE
jgi:LysR family transcriptional regulator, hydrogen peroxide-inducible genes activator